MYENHLYGKLSLHRGYTECFYRQQCRGKSKRVQKLSIQKKPSKIHTVKWNRIHVHVTMCGVSVCHHHQIVATCTVHECCAYRFMYSTMQVCAQVHKGV